MKSPKKLKKELTQLGWNVSDIPAIRFKNHPRYSVKNAIEIQMSILSPRLFCLQLEDNSWILLESTAPKNAKSIQGYKTTEYQEILNVLCN